MRNILLAATAVSLFALPAAAQSVQSPTYSGSIGYTALDGDNADLGAVTGRFDARLHPNFGLEGEGSVGVRDDDVRFGALNGTVEHKFDAAGYAVGYLPVNPNLELFGRVGYGTTRIRAEVAGVGSADSTESVNYGVGANYFFDGVNGVRGDITRRDFVGDGNGKLDTYGVSYVRRF